MSKNKTPDRILWLDLEMTGLSVQDDHILEIAAIVTDWDFNELDVYEGVVKCDEAIMKDRFAHNASFWDSNSDTRDKLIEQNKNGKSLIKIESELLKFIGKNFKRKDLVLCAGNSIHIDRRFIVKNWPKFESKLHYRMLDVSAWKVVFDGKYKIKFAKDTSHRALDDIRGSMIELKYYLGKAKL